MASAYDAPDAVDFTSGLAADVRQAAGRRTLAVLLQVAADVRAITR